MQSKLYWLAAVLSGVLVKSLKVVWHLLCCRCVTVRVPRFVVCFNAMLLLLRFRREVFRRRDAEVTIRRRPQKTRAN